MLPNPINSYGLEWFWAAFGWKAHANGSKSGQAAGPGNGGPTSGPFALAVLPKADKTGPEAHSNPNHINLYGLLKSMAPNLMKFMWFSDIHGPKPYTCLWFGEIHDPKPYQF